MGEDQAGPVGGEVVRRFGPASSIEDIRRFLLSRGPPSQGAGSGEESIRVTIRFLADEVEVAFASPSGVGSGTRRFGDWFRQRLREQNLTQQAAAHRLGVSGKTVNRWVQGHTEPRMRELRRVSEVFGAIPSL